MRRSIPRTGSPPRGIAATLTSAPGTKPATQRTPQSMPPGDRGDDPAGAAGDRQRVLPARDERGPDRAYVGHGDLARRSRAGARTGPARERRACGGCRAQRNDRTGIESLAAGVPQSMPAGCAGNRARALDHHMDGGSRDRNVDCAWSPIPVTVVFALSVSTQVVLCPSIRHRSIARTCSFLAGTAVSVTVVPTG